MKTIKGEAIKMIDEFNLSKKRQDTNKGTNFIRFAYLEEDVKEFIRLLKERLCYCKEDMECAHCQVINKLVGEKE